MSDFVDLPLRRPRARAHGALEDGHIPVRRPQQLRPGGAGDRRRAPPGADLPV